MNDKDFRIAVFDTKPYDRFFFEEENKKYGFDITYFEAKLRPRTANLTAGFDAVCAFVNDELDEQVMEQLHKNGVKLVAMRCAGYNNVNLQAACKFGIQVVRVPQYSPYAVAEYALALLMTLNRKVHRAYNRVREGNFSIGGLMGFDLRGKTIGVIGTGKIGRTFIGLLRGFGMRVLAYDPYPNPEHARELNFEYVPLETVFRESDIISLHCPLTPENHHMINDETIAMMKKGIVLINTRRGRLIHSAALVNGLKSGRIGAAGLDVYEEETDYFFEDRSDRAVLDDILARLMTFPNVIVSSHQAFFTAEAERNIAGTTMKSFGDFAAGRTLENSICLHCDGLKQCPGRKPGAPCPAHPR
ncbi:MAG: 2-hydroxyacid dehydrogenase [Lentisphaeria bacterium]|nr:2-hydroxyacid dehydrogenase [Lentisphaeria bacterium]